MNAQAFETNHSTSRNDRSRGERSGVGSAVDSIVEAGSSVASQVGSAASEVGKQVSSVANGAIEAGTNAANYAAEQAKSLTSEIETFARRNPLGALGGALAVGVLIGLIGRRA